MRIKLLFAAILFSAAGVYAQNRNISRIGAYENNAAVIIGQPYTTLAVDVTTEREAIVCGPYARYAQKYLGVRAPLTDKVNYFLKNASVALLRDNSYNAPIKPTTSSVVGDDYVGNASEFARLLPDKTDMTIESLEDAAKAAAQTIFSLRKHRMDLITGEAGENVFGEGLNAALAKIDELERGYLELFLGKRSVASETRRYVVIPKSDERQYIVCRFSAKDGLLPDTDLSGEIVLLQIMPSGNTVAVTEAGVKDTNVIEVRLADYTTCTVLCGNSELAKVTLPVFEFGRTVRIPAPKKK